MSLAGAQTANGGTGSARRMTARQGDRVLAALGVMACEADLAAHGDAVYRRFGRVGLGVIDLPSLSGSSVVREQVRIAGVLYWAGELDDALLISVIEALAQSVFLGAAPPALAPLSGTLAPIFRARRTRLQPGERAALLARVHGGLEAKAARALESDLASLAGALVAIGAEPADRGIESLVARADVLANDLAARLSERAVGMSAFAAREIVGQIREAVGILRTPAMRRAYGNQGWTTSWQLAAQALLGRTVDPVGAIRRAVSGQRLIAWLAARTPLTRTSAVLRDAASYGAAMERAAGAAGGPV